MDLRVQMYAKSGQLKNESKSEMFSAPGDAQESANGTTINEFDVRLMVQFRVHLIIHLELHLKVHFKIYIEVHKKVRLRLHLFMKLPMHKSVQYDSVKGEIMVALYAVIESPSKISF